MPNVKQGGLKLASSLSEFCWDFARGKCRRRRSVPSGPSSTRDSGLSTVFREGVKAT